jgi:hypothetical protein
VAISVYEGNTGDAKTLMPPVAKLRGHKRHALLEATGTELGEIRDRVWRGWLVLVRKPASRPGYLYPVTDRHSMAS